MIPELYGVDMVGEFNPIHGQTNRLRTTPKGAEPTRGH